MFEDQTYILADKEDAGLRIDRFLTKHFPHYSRSYFQKLIDKRLVTINSKVIVKGMRVHPDDEIEAKFILSEDTKAIPQPIALDILYEDEHLLVINKPPGLVVHPAAGNPKDTFVNAFLHHLKRDPTKDPRPGIVHRLDKETSGLLVAAKNVSSQAKLVSFFAERKMQKVYLAVALGHVKSGSINTPIRRNARNRQKMIAARKGKEALTVVENLKQLRHVCCLKIKPLTGRTHQIRVHLQSIHRPILGDKLYGRPALNEKYGATRQLLHAYQLAFTHPATRQELDFTAPLMDDMTGYFEGVEI